MPYETHESAEKTKEEDKYQSSLNNNNNNTIPTLPLIPLPGFAAPASRLQNPQESILHPGISEDLGFSSQLWQHRAMKII